VTPACRWVLFDPYVPEYCGYADADAEECAERLLGCDPELPSQAEVARVAAWLRGLPLGVVAPTVPGGRTVVRVFDGPTVLPFPPRDPLRSEEPK
jgi:hypothetical protein